MPPRKRFPYEEFEDVGRRVKSIAENIQMRIKTTTPSLIGVGCQLCRVKSILPQGSFTDWLDAEFGWSDRTAQRLMRLSVLEGKTDTVSLLSATALYALTKKSTPVEVREAILDEMARNGALPDDEIIRRAKAPRAQADLSPDWVDPGTGRQDHEAILEGFLSYLVRSPHAEAFLTMLERIEDRVIIFRLEEMLDAKRAKAMKRAKRRPANQATATGAIHPTPVP